MHLQEMKLLTQAVFLIVTDLMLYQAMYVLIHVPNMYREIVLVGLVGFF